MNPIETATTYRKESDMDDITNTPAGCLPIGTMLPQGRIVDVSSTAYQVESGAWVPFYGPRGVHTRRGPVTPLVTFEGW